jgi:hypothetical protein
VKCTTRGKLQRKLIFECYMLVIRILKEAANQQTGNTCFENVAQFLYLGTTITNQNLIQEEIKRSNARVMVATIPSRTFYLLVCLRT